LSRSLKFANMLAAELRSPTVGLSQRGALRIEGQLDSGVVLAHVVILVSPRFKGLKRAPPKVFCDEPWMKVGAEWHNGPPLCWVLSDEWRDVMNWRGKPVAAIMDEGRRWFLEGVRCLVNRHYSAHLDGRTVWPAEWSSWGHYRAGAREYRQAKTKVGRSK
jgi:hypothetical protein